MRRGGWTWPPAPFSSWTRGTRTSLTVRGWGWAAMGPRVAASFIAYVEALRAKEGMCVPPAGVLGLVAANLVSLAVGTVTSLLLCRARLADKASHIPPASYAP